MQRILAVACILSVIISNALSCNFINVDIEPNEVYTITSIGYPFQYPSYYHSCMLTGSAPPNHKVYTYCEVFDVLYSDNCYYTGFAFSESGDSTFISDGQVYCGTTDNLTFVTTGPAFALQFYNYYQNIYSQRGYLCYVAAWEDDTNPSLSSTVTSIPSTTVTSIPSTTDNSTPSTTVNSTPSTTVNSTPSTTVNSTTSTTVNSTPSTTVTSTPSTTVTSTPSTTVTTSTTSFPTSLSTNSSTSNPSVPPKPDDCDCGRTNSVSRIVGGIETDVNEYPFLVALELTSTSIQFCGGTLISTEWVLTAAHCLAPFNFPQEIMAHLGEHDSSTESESPSERINAILLIKHNDYNEITIDNDIGLIQLERPVIYSNIISPVCLPYVLQGTNLEGEIGTVAGWGTTSHLGSPSNVALEVDLPIISNYQCNQYESMVIHVTENMFCTYDPGFDACAGDSGGPLMLEDDGRTYLIGIVSWGLKCAEEGNPGVFTKVNNYLDWIQTQTGETFCGE